MRKINFNFFLLFIITIITLLLFFNCNTPGSSGGGGGGEENEIITTDYNAMVHITEGKYVQTDGIISFSHTVSKFQLGKYEVTYDLWYTVYQWAILPANGYTFANAGREGSSGVIGATPTTAKYEPVTTINWRDAIVWCNAYSEMSCRTPVYYTSDDCTIPLRISTNNPVVDATAGSEDNPYVNWSANGYRLPTEGEWQFVASNKGATSYDYLSGATTYYNDNTSGSGEPGKSANDAVAVYGDYWNGSAWIETGVTKTANIGTKNANQLAIFDMSGNIYEWCWDWVGNYPVVSQTNYRGPGSGVSRILRGGCWNKTAFSCQIGYRDNDDPGFIENYIGFRLVRTGVKLWED